MCNVRVRCFCGCGGNKRSDMRNYSIQTVAQITNGQNNSVVQAVYADMLFPKKVTGRTELS